MFFSAVSVPGAGGNGGSQAGSVRRGQSCLMADTGGCSWHPAGDHRTQLWGNTAGEPHSALGLSEQNRSVRKNPVTLSWGKKGERLFRHHSKNFLGSPWNGAGRSSYPLCSLLRALCQSRWLCPEGTAACEGPVLKKADPEELQPIQRAHTGSVLEGLQTMKRSSTEENCEEEEAAEWNS